MEGVEQCSINNFHPPTSFSCFVWEMYNSEKEGKEEAFPFLAILAKNICRLGAGEFPISKWFHWLSHSVLNLCFCIKGGQRQKMQRQTIAWFDSVWLLWLRHALIWVELSDLMYSIMTRMTLIRSQGVNMGDDSSGLKKSEAELLHPVPSGSWRQLEAGGPRQVWRRKNGYVTPARSSYM